MADQTNFQVLPTGFGSYLQNILPQDIAVSAGAFSFAMQQIKNIYNVEFEKFAQVASSIEVVNAGLNLVNGTDVPVNTTLAQQGTSILALGSGPNGSFTASDVFGCMSGLPYSWTEMQNCVKGLQTTKLSNIYNQLYLATTWEAASVTVQYSTDNSGPSPVYTVTGVTLTEPGGGYGRGTAPAPTITISGGSGATATCTIGTDSSNLGTNGAGTYGRVLSVTLTSPGSPSGTIPTISIQCPPTATLAVDTNGAISTSGTNTSSGTLGWPGMNSVLAAYITQAETEILAISATNPKLMKQANAAYSVAGTQLMIEQRTRFTAFSPVPSPKDYRLSPFPSAMATFTDALGTYALSTLPHMYAQTVEAICDMSTVGGQSITALMRQERNAARLQEMGVTLDNQIPGLPAGLKPVLLCNGTAPVGTTGVDVTGLNGDLEDPVTTYTNPAVLMQQIDSELVAPNPMGYYDPNTLRFIKVDTTTAIDEQTPVGDILRIENNVTNNNLLGPNRDGTGPAVPINTVDALSIQSGVAITDELPVIEFQPIAIVATGVRVASGQGTPLDVGKPNFPGSLAGSPAINTIDPELNLAYTSSTLLPSFLTVQEAIADVIKCNCDCWVD